VKRRWRVLYSHREGYRERREKKLRHGFHRLNLVVLDKKGIITNQLTTGADTWAAKYIEFNKNEYSSVIVNQSGLAGNFLAFG